VLVVVVVTVYSIGLQVVGQDRYTKCFSGGGSGSCDSSGTSDTDTGIISGSNIVVVTRTIGRSIGYIGNNIGDHIKGNIEEGAIDSGTSGVSTSRTPLWYYQDKMQRWHLIISLIMSCVVNVHPI
jgi:hypothetical protein